MATRKEKYLYSRALLVLAAGLYLFNHFFSDYLDEETKWRLFDLTNLLLISTAFGSALLVTPYAAKYLKITACALFLTSLWYLLVDYPLVTFFEGEPIAHTIRRYTGWAFVVIFVPMYYLISARSTAPSGRYNKKATFKCYKNPKNTSGLLISLYTGFGTVSLVTAGKEYAFIRDGKAVGRLKEIDHVYNPKNTYKVIKPLSKKTLQYLRDNMDRKWRWYDHCFFFFLRIL